jgi:hypothetical protein
MTGDPTPKVHGESCEKAPHENREGGYLHGPEDDSPFDVDGVMYCGRCHQYLPPDPTPREPRDCKHGNLARSCEVCELESRVSELEQQLNHYREALSARHSQAQALEQQLREYQNQQPTPWRIDDHIVEPGDGGGRTYLFNIDDFNDGPPIAEFYDREEAERVQAILNQSATTEQQLAEARETIETHKRCDQSERDEIRADGARAQMERRRYLWAILDEVHAACVDVFDGLSSLKANEGDPGANVLRQIAHKRINRAQKVLDTLLPVEPKDGEDRPESHPQKGEPNKIDPRARP